MQITFSRFFILLVVISPPLILILKTTFQHSNLDLEQAVIYNERVMLFHITS